MAGLGLFMRRRGLATHPAVVDILKDSLIGAYSFAGKSNGDADWNIVKDMSGKGEDLKILGMTPSGSDGYQADGSFYKDSTSKGYCQVALPPLQEITIIVKRKRYTLQAWQCFLSVPLPSNSDTAILYMDQNGTNNVYDAHSCRSFTHYIKDSSINSSDGVMWMNSDMFNNKTMGKASVNYAPFSGGNLYIGKISASTIANNWRIYSLYIFNKSLTPELIEQFIQENIDESYVLP